MAYIPQQSILATQGTVPWSVLGATTNIGSVITTSQGSVATVIIGGSIAASFTPPANQSVSGTVQTDVRGSVAVAIISGSIAATFTPPANQSVSGAVSVSNFPTNQNVSGSVVAFQGTTPWVTVGSVYQGTGWSGSVAAIIVGGSIATATTNSSVMLLTGTNMVGSVAAYQGSVPWAISGSVAAFQAGTNITSIVSTVPSSVIVGASIFGQLPAGTAVLGSVATLQGTNPWTVTGAVSVSGTAQVQVQASIAAVIIGGSIATATTNSSVMLLTSTNMVGSIAAYQGSVPWAISGSVAASLTNSTNASVITIAGVDQLGPQTSILLGVTANTNGSVLTTTGYSQALLQITSGPGASMTGAINFEGTLDGTQFVPISGYNLSTNAISSMATVESDWAFNVMGLQGMRARVSNWTVGSITARAVASPEDARPIAVLAAGNQSVSGSLGASIIGQLPGGTATLGSITAIQGTNPYIMTGSIQGTVSVLGTVPVTQSTNPWIIGSIVGTYAEDAAHATTNSGLFTLGVRNDAVSSMTSAESDYSPIAVDAQGRTVISHFAGPQACIISYVGSIVSGSVQLIQASVIGSRSYITDFWLSNTGATTTLFTFQGGDTSIVGQFIVPTGGGNNGQGIHIPLRTTLSQDLAFKVSPSSSVIYVTAKGYQAP